MRALILLAALFASSAFAAQATLAWDAAAGASGYIVSYGTVTGAYSASVDTGAATSVTIANLTQGTTYYFAVRARNASGVSGYSNEVSATMPVCRPRGNSGKCR